MKSEKEWPTYSFCMLSWLLELGSVKILLSFLSYAMKKASELVGQCVLWKFPKSGKHIHRHGPQIAVESHLLSPSSGTMTNLCRKINYSYIQEATLKDHPRYLF